MKQKRRTFDYSSETFNAYQASLKKSTLLSEEDEKTLGQRIRQGDIEARNKLVEANLRFVVKCAEEFSTYQVPLEELISAGNAALVASAERYDHTFENRFLSYAVRNIKQSMNDAVNERTQMVHIPTNRLKDIKFRYESFDTFDSPYAEGDDEECLTPQNKIHAEPTISQNEWQYDEVCEALRHLFSPHFTSSEVDFLMDYAQMKEMGYDIKALAYKHRLPLRMAKRRLEALLAKVNNLHLYAAYLDQAA